MPELVEVENFRQLLLRLKKSKDSSLILQLPSPTPPKVFPSKSEIDNIQKCFVSDVERKGKLLRLVLHRIDDRAKGYLYIHMGMTGRISTADNIPPLESLSSTESFPPPHTHLIFKVGDEEVAFSDPRRFGAVSIGDPLRSQWDEFACDALDPDMSLENLAGQKKAVKAILLDQRAVVSGVGNWIADEILYQSKIHPAQTFLSTEEAGTLERCLRDVLDTGIRCLTCNKDFPPNWLFHRRWNKRKSDLQKDCNGNIVKFVQVAGRTSAIVPSVQKLVKSRKKKNTTTSSSKSRGTPVKVTSNEKIKSSGTPIKVTSNENIKRKVEEMKTKRKSKRISGLDP